MLYIRVSQLGCVPTRHTTLIRLSRIQNRHSTVPYRNSGDIFAVLATIYSCLTLPIYLHTFLWLTLIQSKQARKQIQIDYRLLLFQWKYTKTPMSKFQCFGHAVKGQCLLIYNRKAQHCVLHIYRHSIAFFLFFVP